MEENPNEEREIRNGSRISAFLADKEVKAAFTRLRERYGEDWLTGESPMDREAIWHKRRALDDLERELKSVVEAGQRASHMREVRERRLPARPRTRH